MMRRDAHTVVSDDPQGPPMPLEYAARRSEVLMKWFNGEVVAKAKKDGRIFTIGPITVRE